jgi:predicted ribosome quality control (RQC) complex YloA/Tae2 family protein
MGMNDAEIDLVVHECQQVVGARVTQVWQPARDRLYLALEGMPFLLLVPRGPFARVHFHRERPPNPQRPFSFQGHLRAHLHGWLTAVERVPGERQLALHFTTGHLMLRLTGRSGGLWWFPAGADRPEASIDGPCDQLAPLAIRPGRPDDPCRFPVLPGPFGASEGAQAFFEHEERVAERAHRRRDTLSRAAAERKRLQRLTAHLLEDVDKGERAASLRRQADALGAALYRVPAGAHRVEVPDLDDGTVWEVSLDPRESPGKNLNRLYERVRRLDTVARRAAERWEVAQRAMDALDGRMARCQQVDAADADFDALRAALPSPRASAKHIAATDWDVWNGPAGAIALVGKNERGNRRLCFQIARANDWWVHARERPGPHVILRVGRHQTPSLETLLAAAQLALGGLRMPLGQAADVHYARANHIRSIPGGAHARVVVRDERVLRVVRAAGPPAGWLCEPARTAEDGD